ncbi:MAG: MtrAB system histidine kinase MtrB [Actinomycetota bacterium]|nr:MtrAB system histidine kinase MtrB [Actinomycetota bacterium]
MTRPITRIRRGVRRLDRYVVGRWRRSLQLRVVGTTLLASGIVVVLLGLVLLNQIAGGLLGSQRKAAIAETTAGLQYAQSQLSAIGGAEDPALQQTLLDIGRFLSNRGGAGGLYNVVIQPTSGDLERVGPADVDISIPSGLRDLVKRRGEQGYVYALEPTADGGRVPALVVGAPVFTGAGLFELYYVFPLQTEAETIQLVKQTLATAGLVLVVLLAGIAALVTRQAVTPVRIAARTAERLAAGLLEERMAVRGEDDLARLATSFNDMAASLQRQIAQLEELSRLQRRFTSDVSHELRTPLTTVRMAADVLHAARADFAPEVARSAELLQDEVDRFESLLTDLLEISRYDAGFAVLEPEPTDVGALAGRVVDALRPVAAHCGSELAVRPPASRVVAEVDPRRVERVLRNLIGNALEHGEGRPVELTIAGDAEAVAVTVRDYGLGLRAGEHSLVFNRFWRADPSRARQSGGTGLGLSISREDARLHGGWLQAWGAPGRGAQFRLTLPLRHGAALTGSPLPLEPIGDEPRETASTGGGRG